MKVNNEKLYLLFEPNLPDLKNRNVEFAHPEIRLGRAYGQGQYWEATADLTFQINVLEESCEAYAGHLKCNINVAPAVAKAIVKASAKGYELAPNEHDQLKLMIVGLRALGYRRASLRNGSSEVVSTS